MAMSEPQQEASRNDSTNTEVLEQNWKEITLCCWNWPVYDTFYSSPNKLTYLKQFWLSKYFLMHYEKESQVTKLLAKMFIKMYVLGTKGDLIC